MRITYTIEDLLDLMEDNNLTVLTKQNLQELNAQETILENTTLTKFECPKEIEEEEEVLYGDDTVTAKIQVKFQKRSRNAYPGFQINEPSKVKRYDKLKHILSGTVLTVTYVHTYPNGDVLHVVQREKPWDNELIIKKGDSLEIIKK